MPEQSAAAGTTALPQCRLWRRAARAAGSRACARAPRLRRRLVWAALAMRNGKRRGPACGSAGSRFLLENCPSNALCLILEGLNAGEAGRVCLLVSKQFAALRGGDAEVWTQMVAVRARAFLSASVFFRGPRNATLTSLSDRRMTELFAGASEAADAKFAQVLADAGPALIGAEWTHDNQHLKYEWLGSPDLAISVVVPGRVLLGDLTRFPAAFACDVCLGSSAVRQCAACHNLLCAECAVRCAFDHDSQRARAPTCAFAMCVECDDAVRALDDAVRAGGGEPLSDLNAVLDDLYSDNPSPRLYEQVCEHCREEDTELCCPAHVSLVNDIQDCEECEFQGCISHGRIFNWCEACEETTCSECMPTESFRCCERCLTCFCGKCKDTARGSHFFCTECGRNLCSSCMRRGGCDRCNEE
jgi:hypothetical protein